MTLEEGPEGIQEQKKVEAIPTLEEEISKIQHLDIEPQTELVSVVSIVEVISSQFLLSTT